MLEASGDPAAPSKSRSRSRGRRKRNEVPAGYRVAEIYFERRGGRSIVGNIYKGRVDNVLAGLEAAFVDIGLDKNGFLHVDEIVLPGVEQAKRGRGNGPAHHRSAQAGAGDRRPGRQGPARRPRARGCRWSSRSPGATWSTRPPARASASRGAWRTRSATGSARRPSSSIWAAAARSSGRRRTAPRERISSASCSTCSSSTTSSRSASKDTPAPALVFQEADLSVRVVRDIFSEHFERAIVDDEQQHHRLVSFFSRTAPELVDRVELYDGEDPLFEAYGVDPVINGMLERRVDLPSRRLPDHRLRRGADGDRRQHRLVHRQGQVARGSRTRSPRRTSRPPTRSCASCGCATSAASSSSTSSTWPARATAKPC